MGMRSKLRLRTRSRLRTRMRMAHREACRVFTPISQEGRPMDQGCVLLHCGEGEEWTPQSRQHSFVKCNLKPLSAIGNLSQTIVVESGGSMHNRPICDIIKWWKRWTKEVLLGAIGIVGHTCFALYSHVSSFFSSLASAF